jgi:hypothetical protein
MFLCVAAMRTASLHAQSTNFDFQYNFTIAAPAPAVAAESSTFWDRFSASYVPRANEVFADRFQPFNAVNRSPDWANDNARQALFKSVWYTARESALQLPAMVWLDENQRFFGRLLGSSVDSVDEEAVSPLNPSYDVAEHRWWNEMSEKGDLQYGLHPFGASPYAFLSRSFRDAGQLFLQADVRYHFDNFADHHFECALSAPLAHGVSLDVGASYELGRHDDQKKLVIKLFREIGGGGTVSVGVEMQDHPALFAGIDFPM